MEFVFRYRSQAITSEQIEFIRQLIAAHPGATRRRLSLLLCEAWGWKQVNGAPRDMVCRGLLLGLDRAGYIVLPPPRQPHFNPTTRYQAGRRQAAALEIDTTPLAVPLRALPLVEFHSVRRTPQEPLFNGLLEQYHYLGYKQQVGEQLKFLVYAGARPVACFAWSSSAHYLGCRDRFLGWSAAARGKNIHLLAYNSRFLLLPWVRVRFLASHLLSRMTGLLSAAWERVYGHPIYFVETFIDPERYRGTCYRAANWVVMGQTTGRGKNAWSKKPTRSIKQVLGYPLTPHFREFLAEV
jgi:Domain of unknown function (DUF4338)